MVDTTFEKQPEGLGKIYSRGAKGGGDGVTHVNAVKGQFTYWLWAAPVLRWSDSTIWLPIGKYELSTSIHREGTSTCQICFSSLPIRDISSHVVAPTQPLTWFLVTC